jgi:hypothetical protein
MNCLRCCGRTICCGRSDGRRCLQSGRGRAGGSEAAGAAAGLATRGGGRRAGVQDGAGGGGLFGDAGCFVEASAERLHGGGPVAAVGCIVDEVDGALDLGALDEVQDDVDRPARGLGKAEDTAAVHEERLHEVGGLWGQRDWEYRLHDGENRRRLRCGKGAMAE